MAPDNYLKQRPQSNQKKNMKEDVRDKKMKTSEVRSKVVRYMSFRVMLINVSGAARCN